MRTGFVAALLLLGTAVSAQTIPGDVQAPTLAARSYILLDFQSGKVLAARDADLRIEPASLSKLMTAYVVFDALRQKRLSLAQTVVVSEKAWRAPGSRTFLELGSQPTVEELLHGMIVQSGNDAAIALAETVAGSEEAFVQAMNREAARMKLQNTRFENATGLPRPGHYSSAADLAVIAAAIIREFPQYFRLYALREYRYNNITQYNRNRLLGRDPFVDGMKTGFTEGAGFCMVATAQRAQRRLIAVVIDAGSDNGRLAESQKLLNYGFEAFDTFRLYAKGQPVHALPVWKGAKALLQAGFADDFYVTIPKGRSDRLKAQLESLQPLLAPVYAGERVGTLKLTFDGQPYGEHSVVALESVRIANVLVRAWHSLRLLITDPGQQGFAAGAGDR
jgi:D-alanyl-D-alanine carboxypeptidase (penicillin-binding protein 5/6)